MQSPDTESGHGPSTVVPPEVRKWNWGAFCLTWIWGVFNNTFIALLCLIPFVNLVMAFVLGFKGNEWAWRNRKWPGIQQFHETQRNWAIAALCVWASAVIFLGGIVGFTFFTLKTTFSNSKPYKVAVETAVNNPEVKAMLGDNIEEGFMAMGNIEIDNSNGSADLAIPLKGSKGEGKVYIKGVREAGQWRFTMIKFGLTDSDNRINLLNDEKMQ